MSNYSNEQFRNIVSDKKGNIIFFKEKLREYGLIGEYAKLADEHVELFNRGKEVKEKQHLTWKDAFDQVLSDYTGIPIVREIEIPREIADSTADPVVDALNRIADALERIEQKIK